MHVTTILHWGWNLVVFDESGIICLSVVILCDLDDNCMLSVCNLSWCVNEITEIWSIEQFGTSLSYENLFGIKILKKEYQVDQLINWIGRSSLNHSTKVLIFWYNTEPHNGTTERQPGGVEQWWPLHVWEHFSFIALNGGMLALRASFYKANDAEH